MLTLFALAAGCGDNRPYDPDALPCEPVDDGNDCTNDICDENGQPTSVDRGAGETCGGGVCDGDGNCVECIEDEDCGDGESCTEADNTCNPITCTDGKQNGDETDVDCGGSCAPSRRCGDTLGCNVANDCQSGVCSGAGGTCTAARCGDGVEQSGETCDDGNDTNGDGCDDGAGDACRPTGCGNGVVTAPEACDDGNNMNGDGCDNNCTATGCGNGVRTGTETCDDGDTMAGDGCSGTCTTEPGFTCDMATPNVCIGACGDGVVVTGEACDDAPPAENGDGCSMTCTLEPGFNCTGSPSTCTTVCGDGVRVGTEGCDDGGTMAGDGCNSNCFVEPGWICAGTPSSCFPICGDGIVRPGEACDDGDLMPGDGCRANCTIETGYGCTGSPSLCAPICGDGMRIAPEVCDDGNAIDGDGCTTMCASESGWTCNMASPTVCTSTCGDGIPVGAEACDDGDTMGGDGCGSTCAVETGFTCTGAPSACTPICGDNLVVPGEPCDDAAPAEDGDGCSATCTVELGYQCQGSPSVCALTCGNDVIDAGETCDDGNLDPLDGCSTTCAQETGWTCVGTPSVCTSMCGDGVTALGAEECDDAPPAEDGDGCSATCTIDTGYTCTGAPSACNTTCGDGITAGAETCDDGCGPDTPGVCDPMDNNDGCSSTCVNECGNGVFNPLVEQCDDGGRIGGDGCSATCLFEVTCGAGETLVQINSTDVPRAIPDHPAPNGVDSNALVPSTHVGAIRKVHLGLGRLTHTFVGDLTLSLLSPGGKRRNLSVNRGGTGDNFITTRFDDDAAVSITTILPAGAPYSAAFQPEQTLSDAAGFRGLTPAGTWQLRAVDSVGGDTGSIVGWTLSVCYDPAAPYCGNGVTDAGEECDDGNANNVDACNNVCGITDGCGDGNIDAGEGCDDDNQVSGDGCSSACVVDIGCGPGETPVSVSNLTPFPIPDNVAAGGALSPVTVATVGAVTRVVPHVAGITHPNATDLDIYLVGPNGVTREMSTDNGGSGDNYLQTYIDDTATATVTSGVAPFTGRFRPELSLSTTPGTDFRAINAAGVWNLRVADDLSGNTGTLEGWTLTLCVNPTAPYCGDGVQNGVDECDDGNLVDNDSCTNRCQITDGCGDGNLDPGEECDDDNQVSGDGCSSTCVFDISCAAGQVPVVVRNPTTEAIPDDPSNSDGTLVSTISMPQAGVVRKVHVLLNAASPVLADFDIFLISPYGTQRTLTNDRSGTAYSGTVFADAGPNAIAAGVNPYTGTFRPVQTISDAAGFANQAANGSWSLRINDDLTNNSGTLNNWGLALCVDPAVTSVCGNGFVEPSETCDDANAVAGDGCASCQVELNCPGGQTPVLIPQLGNPQAIRDNGQSAMIITTATINVAQTGTVRRAVAVVASLSHAFVGDVDITLTSPGSTTLALSDNRGGGGLNFASTLFDDNATTAISAGSAPFRGRFRPEQALSGFNGQGAAGNWTINVSDSAGADGGSFNSWVLGLCVE